VRWAHAALLAVVLPACAHGGSNESVENPATNTEDNPPAVQQQPADREWVLAQGGETNATTGEAKAYRQRIRPVFLAAADVNAYVQESRVEAEAPNCDPWSGKSGESCDLSEMVTESLR
jgi:hypothetical protein